MTQPEPEVGLAVGTVINGQYRIESTLGAGGMGIVYRASRIEGGEDVAIKIILEQDDVHAIAELTERFEREAKALFGMEHPHLLRVYDSGVMDGRPYLVMELLEGAPLDIMVEDGPLPPDEAFELARQILSGLAFAHSKGVVHRDLKTENVFVSRGPDGAPCAKILDFGLVKFVDDERWGASAKLTMTGAVFGTPAYMSPEQCAGAKVDSRGDVYACGVILFELLTGEWPFMEESRMEMFKAHLTKPVPPIAETVPGSTVAPELDAVISKAMSKVAKQRFQDAGEMLAAVQAVPQPAMTVSEERESLRAGSPSSPLLNPFSDPPGLRVSAPQFGLDGQPLAQPAVEAMPVEVIPAAPPAVERPPKPLPDHQPAAPGARGSYLGLGFAALVLLGLAAALAWLIVS